MVAPPYILGLDLHGTLLEPGELMREELVGPLAKALSRMEHRAKRFICTGNDLSFVLDKVPAPVLEEIDGCVLETGCSKSLDLSSEEVIVTPEEQGLIKELEAGLKSRGFAEADYFAHRLTTVSMFCKDPPGFCEKVYEHLSGSPVFREVHITYSSVAVDIIPAGYDKYRGLEAVSEGRETIGVADSMNDRALLENADYALAPGNIAPELLPLLQEAGREVRKLAAAGALARAAVLKASARETRGVLQVLEFLDRVID